MVDDEKYYETVAREIRENRINDALWTKAIAKSMGDENKTKAVYIQLRVDQLIKEEQEQQFNASRESQIAGASEEAWEEIEEDFKSKRNKEALLQWGKLLGEIIIFVGGVYAIYKWLWPWLRSIRGQIMG